MLLISRTDGLHFGMQRGADLGGQCNERPHCGDTGNECVGLANAVVRVMVAEGGAIRYGPAPRGPLESDTTALLSIRQGFQFRS